MQYLIGNLSAGGYGVFIQHGIRQSSIDKEPISKHDTIDEAQEAINELNREDKRKRKMGII